MSRVRNQIDDLVIESDRSMVLVKPSHDDLPYGENTILVENEHTQYG